MVRSWLCCFALQLMVSILAKSVSNHDQPPHLYCSVTSASFSPKQEVGSDQSNIQPDRTSLSGKEEDGSLHELEESL